MDDLAMSATTTDEVVIFQPEFIEFGGEERVILALSEGLHVADVPHRVVCYHDHIGLNRFAREPLTVQTLSPADSGWSKVAALRRLLLELDAIAAPTPMLFNIQSAMHVGLAGRLGGLRYHLRIPDTYSLLIPPAPDAKPLRARLRKPVRDWATGLGMRHAQSLFTNTAALSDEIERLYRRPAQVMYLGGFGEGQATAAERDTDCVHLLSVSRLQGSKRIDWMFRALADLRGDASLPNWRLHVVGSGPERNALLRLRRELGLEDRVELHGFLDDDTLKQLYHQAHIFLMPARQGYGLPAIEALNHHCAVVMNEDSGVSEVLQHTPWVVVAGPGEASFRQALREMMRRAQTAGFYRQALPVLPSIHNWAADLIARAGW